MNTTPDLLMLDPAPTAAAMLLGLLALALLVPYLDRLRMLRWRTHQWRVVGMHLCWALWLGWVAFDGVVYARLAPYHLFGLLGAAMWMSVSQPTWRSGPPTYTESSPAPLDSVPHDAAAGVPR